MKSGSTGQMRSSNPPPGCGGGLRRGPAGVGLGPDCTEKRSLRVGPHGKAQCAWLLAYRMRLLVRRADRVRFSVRGYHQSALFRDPGYPECAFPSHHRPGGVGCDPPARLRGTMKSGSTGQMRSGNPPPGCGGGRARGRKPRLGARPHGKAQFGQRASLMERPGSGRDTIRLPVVG